MSGIAQRWRLLSGKDNWDGLLDPFDSDLRRYLIHYGTMAVPAIEAFIDEKASINVGLSRYAPENLLAQSGVVKGNPFKYEVTKYFYAPSTITLPDSGYTVRPTRSDAVLKESNWIGYVAVATDEGKVALGRRDILIVWRGIKGQSKWDESLKFSLVNAPSIFGKDSDPLVYKGWYDMYTTINQDSVLNGKSARDQLISDEVERLVKLYKDEEVSISVTGHSLGSSIATLNAVDLAVNNKDVLVTAFLFASPKVGDENFKNAFSNQPNLRAMRISDLDDTVTKVPQSGQTDNNGGDIPFVDVGVGLEIESKKSNYLNPPNISAPYTHDLMLYMHGIDVFQGSQGLDFDFAQVNKDQDALKDEKRIPKVWLAVTDHGMVQQEDGTYILDDREPYEPF